MTTNGTLDERYLTWLHRKFEPDTQRNPARSHWLLFADLYQIEFSWFIPNDDNRFYDGLDIRQEFIDKEEGGDVPDIWLAEACSFLEMIVALSYRMAYESEFEADFWFWKMIDNLNLRSYVDEKYDDDAKLLVDETINTVVERTYLADGKGGLFPLAHPGRDQREVELWYQMSQYLMENITI